jgi:hypothetical protein
VGLRAGLVMWRREDSFLYCGSNSDPSANQPIVRAVSQLVEDCYRGNFTLSLWVRNEKVRIVHPFSLFSFYIFQNFLKKYLRNSNVPSNKSK